MSSAILEREPTTAIAEPDDAKWAPAVSYFDPEFKTYVVGQLRRLGALEPGWDGYRAPAIDVDIIEAAIGVIDRIPEHLSPRPKVVPLSSGALQFEWVEGPKALEMEFESPTTIHFLQWNSETQTSEEDSFGVHDMDMVEGLIRWFTRPDVPREPR